MRKEPVIGYDCHNLNPTGGVSMTLMSAHTDTHSVPVVCYGICSYESNSMRSDNPNTGIYEAETARTLDLNGANPACNQGGMMVVSRIKKHEPVLLESNQNHAVVKEDGICTSLTASMGLGGDMYR